MLLAARAGTAQNGLLFIAINSKNHLASVYYHKEAYRSRMNIRTYEISPNVPSSKAVGSVSQVTWPDVMVGNISARFSFSQGGGGLRRQ